MLVVMQTMAPRPWHDRHMSGSPAQISQIAQSLGRCYIETPYLIAAGGLTRAAANLWRLALRQANVPVLELNEASSSCRASWLAAARAFSAEYFSPVVVFGADDRDALDGSLAESDALRRAGREVDHHAWLTTRQAALTRAVETSALNREFRRARAKEGWIIMGWQPEAALAEGNGLLLAWSSPLPLLRLRNFAARCPHICLSAPDAPTIADEVAAQGISVTGWRFAVK